MPKPSAAIRPGAHLTVKDRVVYAGCIEASYRQVYKSYPVYAPGEEPAGYLDWLRTQEPKIAFDASKLKTEEDWIRAGELVFDTPIATGSIFGGTTNGLYLREPKWYEKTRALVAKDGTLPFYRYVVTERGKIEVGIFSCGMCHTRVMPDGGVIKGAQGNFSFHQAAAYDYRAQADNVEGARALERFLFTAPWVYPQLETQLSKLSLEDITSAHEAIPPGVLARHRSSISTPVQIPDLTGVKERRYLDRSGLQLHHSIVDLMRYAALNQGGDNLARFGEFVPMEIFFNGKLPPPETQSRYSDEQLYALALYVYSLKPPPNMNKSDALARRGQKVFQSEGCAGCHTPPLYTNNKLTPVDGFTVPEEHKKKYDVLPTSVGTDPNLALKTRRGTGYYKVPSLKGVWYRGPFEHSGSVATLEDWFDPNRLKDDYMPTGFKGYGVKTRAVKGHEFGLQLSAEDKRALIAFLKTL
ncbi:MAG: di-heme oxidoredictase family protein [Blastocatellia bacterium]